MAPIAIVVAVALVVGARKGAPIHPLSAALPPWAGIVGLWLTNFTIRGAAERLNRIERAADAERD